MRIRQQPLRSAAILAITVLIAVIPVKAQSGRGTMRGWIEFEGVGRNNVKARGVVARVELVAVDDGREAPPIVTNTDEIGGYLIENVPAGDYVLRIGSPGFRSYEIELYLPSDFECRLATHLKKQ
mgnify:CR=1 FL=1